MKNYMSEVLFLKWCPNVKEQFYEKSKLKQKHKAIGNNVMETILQEGNEFILYKNCEEDNFKRKKTDERNITNLNDIWLTTLNRYLQIFNFKTII